MDQIKRLEVKRKIAEAGGSENGQQSGIATNFPKNPPPVGIAYSKNFARAQKGNQFAVQVKG
jgi:hypothetical protein